MCRIKDLAIWDFGIKTVSPSLTSKDFTKVTERGSNKRARLLLLVPEREISINIFIK